MNLLAYLIAGVALVGALMGAVWWADANIETTAGVRRGQAETKAQWDAANEDARRSAEAKDEEHRIAKEKADAANAKTRRDLDGVYAAYRSLRDSKFRSFLPPAPAAATGPDRITFNRAALDSALSKLDSGTTGLLKEGNTAIVDLDNAKKWGQGIMTGQ